MKELIIELTFWLPIIFGIIGTLAGLVYAGMSWRERMK